MRLVLLIGIFALVLAALWSAPSAAAQMGPCAATTPAALVPAAPGQLAEATIRCSFSGLGEDLITVLDRDGDARPGTWADAADVDADLWLFDAAADGDIDLVIDFSRTDRDLVAHLYDDQNGDGQVSIDRSTGTPRAGESRYWTLEAVAHGGWWTDGERVNFNLTFRIDGNVFAMASYDRFLDRLPTDGQVDFVIEVRDPRGIGAPQYDFRYATDPLPESWGLNRVNLAVDEQYDRPRTFDYGILWSLLGNATLPQMNTGGAFVPVSDTIAQGQRFGLVQDYGHLAPPIQVDWATASVAFLAELNPTRATDHGWFSYAHARYTPGIPYQLDFEAPFAFYDLAGDADGIPELTVRSEYYWAGDPYFRYLERYTFPTRMVRYSWDQDNDGVWDYSVNPLGKVDLAQQPVALGDHRFITVPYEDYPQQVLRAQWDAITFVQDMGNQAASQEGIYVWSGLNQVRDGYLIGLSEQPGLEWFETIAPGYRGELAIQPALETRLYFSPIDRQLHLLGAQHGLWNIDDRWLVTSTSVGGTYIDQWRVTALSGEPGGEQQLNVLPEHLVLSDGGTVRLRTADLRPWLFKTYPPHNTTSWRMLQRMLTLYARPLPDGDLRASYEQFTGPEQVIAGARTRDYQRMADGTWSFVLDIAPGARVHGDRLLNPDDLRPGSYLVRYDGAVSLTPLAPPALSVAVVPGSFQHLTVSNLDVTVRNHGPVQVAGARLVVTAWQPDVAPQQIAEQPLDIAGSSDAQAALVWSPPQPGAWQILAEVHAHDGVVLATGPASLMVMAASATTGGDVLALTGRTAMLAGAGLLALIVAVVATVVTRLGVER